MKRLILLTMLLGTRVLAQDDTPAELRKPRPAPPPKDRRLKELLSDVSITGKVTAAADEISLVVLSVGTDHGIQDGQQFVILRQGETIGRGAINRKDLKWSAGNLTSKKSPPKVGDDVSVGAIYSAEQRKAFLDYAFSFHPLKEEERTRIRGILASLDGDDITGREEASKELVREGGVARIALAAIDQAGLSGEARARIADVLKEIDKINQALQSDGLEHDLEFLAMVDDPRGYERLKRILAGVHPFSVAGVPEKRAGLSEYLCGWWAYSKDKVRWNPAADRYEEK